MKIFVTGGTGFIGSHFVNQAHAAGHDLIALRRCPQSMPRVPLNREPSWLDCPMQSVTIEHLRNCECVVHLAAHSANVPYDSLDNCIIHNVLHPLRLFHTAVEAGIKRFIVAGSCFEYGRSGDRYDFIPIDAPLEPTSSYPASKAAASVAFHGFACEHHVELLIARIFQVYGDGELETRFWPSLRNAALSGNDFEMSDGTQIRDFIHVGKVAAELVMSLTRRDLRAGIPVIENVATGSPMSLAEFAMQQWHSLAAKGNLLLGKKGTRQGEIHRLAAEIPQHPYDSNHQAL